MATFPTHAPSASITFQGRYNRRKEDGSFQTLDERLTDVAEFFCELGKLNSYEKEVVNYTLFNLLGGASGRSFFCAGTDWVKKPENFYGLFNCFSETVEDLNAFHRAFNLLMCGCGAGQVLEQENVDKLPPVKRKPNWVVTGEPGEVILEGKSGGQENTTLSNGILSVGDSRLGWADALLYCLKSATKLGEEVKEVYLGNVRKAGEPLKGFGGTSNPKGLNRLFNRLQELLYEVLVENRGKFSIYDCVYIFDEIGLCVVAGNIRRSAGMKQLPYNYPSLKANLYTQTPDGKWVIKDKKRCLTMSNHTVLYHHIPSYEEVENSVRSQYYSGEGAFMNVREAISRANADILSGSHKLTFNLLYDKENPAAHIDFLCERYFSKYGKPITQFELEHRLSRYGLNPCGEALLRDGLCCLSEVYANQLDGFDFIQQFKVFHACSLFVASLYQRDFDDDKLNESRRLDPRSTVGITGFFDFWVNTLGKEWLLWLKANRDPNYKPFIDKEGFVSDPGACDYFVKVSNLIRKGLDDLVEKNDYYPTTDAICNFSVVWNAKSLGQFFNGLEIAYYQTWGALVDDIIYEYCADHNLPQPNRTRTVKPSGTQSLLTQACPGAHFPVGNVATFIRRITCGREDLVGMAALRQGYSVVTAQSSVDENGELVDDLYHPACTEWLIEIPTRLPWADVLEESGLDLMRVKATTKLSFWENIQNHWTTDNTSYTLDFEESEIPEVAEYIHTSIVNHKGYVSMAGIQKFDSTKGSFPKFPYEGVSKEVYEKMLESQKLNRQCPEDETFEESIKILNTAGFKQTDSSPVFCDSEKCSLKSV